MHEMSIIEALIGLLDDQLRPHPGARVGTVCLRAGRLRQFEPAMLQFCYNAAVRGTSLENSTLEIEELDASARCDVCHLVFAVEEHWFECPRCHSSKAVLVSGNELELMTVELITPTALATASIG